MNILKQAINEQAGTELFGKEVYLVGAKDEKGVPCYHIVVEDNCGNFMLDLEYQYSSALESFDIYTKA